MRRAELIVPRLRNEVIHVRRRRLGETDVSAIGLGGAAWSLNNDLDTAQAIRLIHAALDRGVTLLDTARAYTRPGQSSHNEWLICRALNGHRLRDQVLVATKGGHYRAGDDSFPIDGRPSTLRSHCHDSLQTLGVEQIGLYFLHRPDPDVPIEESVGTLADLRQEGAICMLGVSNVSPGQLARARSVTTIDAVQNHFSPYATQDRAMIEDLSTDGIAYLVYSPLGGARRPQSANAELSAIVQVGRAKGVSPSQVVLAWELAVADNVIPIIGVSRSSTLHDSLSSESLHLSTAELNCIDRQVNSGLPAGPTPE